MRPYSTTQVFCFWRTAVLVAAVADAAKFSTKQYAFRFVEGFHISTQMKVKRCPRREFVTTKASAAGYETGNRRNASRYYRRRGAERKQKNKQQHCYGATRARVRTNDDVSV